MGQKREREEGEGREGGRDERRKFKRKRMSKSSI